MIEQLNFPRVIHAALEAWPISSSWHMEYFFSLPQRVIKSWHTDLLPVYALIALWTIYQKKFYCLKTLFYALAPSVLLYLVMKFSFIEPIDLSFETTHLLGAAVLVTASFFVQTDPSSADSHDFKRLMILVGAFQALALLLPGISRLACCFLALTVQRSSLVDIVLASFTLQAVQVFGWALLFQQTLLPSEVSLDFYLLEQVVFGASLALFVFFSRFSLMAAAAYRISWLWVLI